MITEDYVSFETAKLLKEKGFNEPCRSYWADNYSLSFEHTKLFVSNGDDSVYLLRPTLQMAMKWLREKHKIEIRVIYDNDKLSWYGACNPMNVLFQILLGFGCKSKSYEEACEAAIKYCLENLI